MSENNDIEKNIGVSLRKDELISKVLHYVKEEGLTHFEAILEVCEEYDIDPEDISQLITGPLKEKLRIEAVNLNIISSSKKELANDIIQGCI
jgi:hypothetical protein